MNTFKGRVVVVDDEEEMRALLAEVLTNEGYDVLLFPNAIDAIHAIGSLGDIDVFISDITMSQMNGLEFTHYLKAIRPEVPVILCTAFGSVQTALEAMRAGAYHYMVKPFGLGEMVSKVEEAVEHRKRRRIQLESSVAVAPVWFPWLDLHSDALVGI